MTVRGIIVLEGPDAVGKTQLAKLLVDKYEARYLHLGVHADIWRWHLAAVRRAVRLAETELVVVDRLWLSEQVYGQTFRGGPAYDLGARCLDRVLQRYGALTILCVRKNLPRHLSHFDHLRGQRPEKFESVREVATLYRDLAEGNVAHPGATYLDQEIRHGQFGQRPDVMHYDMDQVALGAELERFAIRAVARLRGLAGGRSDELWRFSRGNLVGGIQKPRYLFVGEELAPQAGTPWPFVWNDAPSGATWLNQALHFMNFDETKALWTNAVNPDPWVYEVLQTFPKIQPIALGRVAEKRLSSMNIRHTTVPHPQWHRRFEHHAGPEGYAKLLKEAMDG